MHAVMPDVDRFHFGLGIESGTGSVLNRLNHDNSLNCCLLSLQISHIQISGIL